MAIAVTKNQRIRRFYFFVVFEQQRASVVFNVFQFVVVDDVRWEIVSKGLIVEHVDLEMERKFVLG